MKKPLRLITIAAATLVAFSGSSVHAGVSADEAAKLKSELMPLGGEKAGNKEGTIPAWTGGLTTPTPGFKNGGRRPDPFADEKPILQITAKNMEAHAAKLSEGLKFLLKKYPDTFRLDVYPTHRTAAAPQYVYDNTFQNATRASLDVGSAGPLPKGALGGIPFPIPKTGEEAMWNGLLRWQGESTYLEANGYQITANGQVIHVQRGNVQKNSPYYYKDMTADTFGGAYSLVRALNAGPPIRAGEAILGHLNVDESKSATWVYLTGQRRVRKLPNACCDTPTPFSAGIVSFDEVEGFGGRMDRFEFKLVGKKEMYIPYNANRILVPTKDADVVQANHLNPDHVRWELHRVWVVEAVLKPGQRHTSTKSLYYLDEDTWNFVLTDRWDANGQLWRMPFMMPMAMPDLPGTVGFTWGTYELQSGAYYVNGIGNEVKVHSKQMSPRLPDSNFVPEAMAGEGVR
ncbi:DUF1329 domain-containing protein [Denitromonas iodatirespirans]|uniref:DUF1329 domain-containing protein n=1 Tax=Denitromonas iodatirespirans TaxID=2795389 RepID=A0A944D7R0_DENI1|nr:DUF1329 domain-containing protein [Denitromonas iodatirespirans]MBT0960102.1 DUF1329 domain-containing protein [Denitromonas iodatirespirans]